MESLKFKDKCQRHLQNKIDYIRINHKKTDENEQQSKPFFCCMDCINEDDQINMNNYQLIKYILKSKSNEILRKWPSNNQAKQIIDKLIELIKTDNNNNNNGGNNIVDQILLFFNDLKKEIIDQIDIQQKKMIEIAESFIDSMTKEEKSLLIGQKYQEISKIQELKQCLLNNNIDITEKEQLCQELVLQSQSNNTIDQLNSLLNEYTPKLKFDIQPAKIIQEQIKNQINSLNLFFQQNNNPFSQSQSNNLNIQFLKTDFQDGQTKLKIIKNNNNKNDNNNPEIKCIKYDGYLSQAVSNIILDPNTKYIFRFKINTQNERDFLHIGLIQDNKKNIEKGYSDNLCCEFIHKNEFICKDDNYGIYKQLKGNEFKLPLDQIEQQLEFRICISENILQMLDYPNYQYQIGIEDQSISILQKAQQLRLFVSLIKENNSVVLTHSEIVHSFD